MAVGVGSSALLIFSIAVLLTLLIGVVASSSCEELVEFGGEMSVLRMDDVRLAVG